MEPYCRCAGMIDACRFSDVQVEGMTMICRDENLNAVPHLQRAYQGVEGGSRWWFQKMQMRHGLDDKGSLGPCPWLLNSHQITRWPKVAVLGCLFAYPGVPYLDSRCSALHMKVQPQHHCQHGQARDNHDHEGESSRPNKGWRKVTSLACSTIY